MSGAFIHPTACLDAGALIGQGTKVWHFSHIMPRANVGDFCHIGQNVFIADGVGVGNHAKIQNNVSLYEGVRLEDFVFCGPGCVFTNIKIPRSAFPRNQSSDYLVTNVEEGASIGANATIVCGVTIGAWSLIGAGAVVTKDVLPHAIMIGVPARQVGWACYCGERLIMRRWFANRAICPVCNRSYRIRRGMVCKCL